MMAANKREEEAEGREIPTHSMRDSVENNLKDSPDLKRPAPEDRSDVFPEIKQGSLKMSVQKKLCLLLILFFLLLIAILAALNITKVYEVPLVLPLANTLFLGIIPIVIASITFKVFKKNGSASVLLIGSGILIFGLGSIAAGWLNPLPGGPNMTVTIHNTCACIGSILILAGAVMSHTPTKSGRAIGSTGTIAATYAAIVVFVTIFSLATLQGMIPPFFDPGSGPTVLRQVILENATAFFALSSVLFIVEYHKGRTDFFFWYSIALALIAIGLLAVFVQPSVGSLIGWVGRSAQYLGFVFALYGMLVARKAATAKGVPLEDVIASFFVDAEQSYKQLVETATDAIITFDEDYRILLWNSAAERMFGYRRDEVIGLSFLKLVIDVRSIAVIKNAKLDISGRDMLALTPVPVEIIGKHKNGAHFPVEVTISRRWQEGRLIQTCILRDITKRKRAEEELLRKNDELAATGEKLKTQFDALAKSERITRLSEERLIMAQKIGRTGSWEYNVQTGKIWGSAEGFHIYGFPPVAGYFPIDDIEACIPERERVHQALTDLITKGADYDIEFVINPADGSAQKFIHSIARLEKDEKGNPLRVVGVIHDITDIWQIEALRESEERFRSLVENSLVGIGISKGNQIVFANAALLEMFGYTNFEKMAIKPLLDHLTPQSRMVVQERMEKLSRHEPVPPVYEHDIIRKDGSIRTLQLVVSTVTMSGENYRQSVFLDITERKRADDSLRHVTRLYALLSQINQAILRTREQDELFRTICQVSIESGQFHMAWVGLIDEADDRIKTVAHAGHEDGYLDQTLITTGDTPTGKGPTGSAFREGEIMISNDIATEPRMIPWRDEALKRGYRSSAAIPFKHKGKPVGTLNLYATEPGFFTADERRLLQEISEDISFALDAMTLETERKQAEDMLKSALAEKEVLLREIHHRVKSNLQLITSLIRLQKEKITDAGTIHALGDSESRIRSMALVHEKLYNSTDLSSIDFSDYTLTLATKLITTYASNPKQIHLNIDIKNVSLDINRAIPLGLIMNELIANASKHAFPDGRSGEITIIGRRTPAGITLSVQDNGVGMPDGLDWRNTTTLGLHLVINLILQEKGSIELNRTGGTAFEMTIPLAREETT